MAQTVAVVAVKAVVEGSDLVARSSGEQERHESVCEGSDGRHYKLSPHPESDTEVLAIRLAVGVRMRGERILSHAHDITATPIENPPHKEFRPRLFCQAAQRLPSHVSESRGAPEEGNRVGNSRLYRARRHGRRYV